jgi:hypothetical protein
LVDFQHHYIPVELAKQRGLYSETSNTMLKEGGVPATTMHRRLYDLDLQLQVWTKPCGRFGSFLSSRMVGTFGRVPLYQR